MKKISLQPLMHHTLNLKTLIFAVSVLLSLATSPSLQAQWRYGVRIGGDINTSSPEFDALLSTKHISGFSGGITFEYQHGDTPWAVDASALYNHSGVKMKYAHNESVYHTKTANDFVVINLHPKYKMWINSIKQLAGPYFYTGPALLVKLDNDEADAPFTTRRLQAGWDVGVGIDIINFIQIQGGYRFGLNNVVNHTRGDWNAVMHNEGVNISVAILFNF